MARHMLELDVNTLTSWLEWNNRGEARIIHANYWQLSACIARPRALAPDYIPE